MKEIWYSVADRLNFPLTTGVYLITFKNSESGRVYIGGAFSINYKRRNEKGFRNRWNQHISALRRRKCHSMKLQNAYNKYGEENIIFKVLEEVLPEECEKREQFYVDKYDSYRNGYNMCEKVCGQKLGFKHSKESLLKMSLNSSFRGKFGKDSIHATPFFQYDIKGNFIRKWDCRIDAQKHLGKSLVNISRSIKIGGTTCGFIWSKIFLGEKIDPRMRQNHQKLGKGVKMLDLDGNVIQKFKSQADAGRFLGKDPTAINAFINKRNNCTHAYGYLWESV